MIGWFSLNHAFSFKMPCNCVYRTQKPPIPIPSALAQLLEIWHLTGWVLMILRWRALVFCPHLSEEIRWSRSVYIVNMAGSQSIHLLNVERTECRMTKHRMTEHRKTQHWMTEHWMTERWMTERRMATRMWNDWTSNDKVSKKTQRRMT